MLKLLNAIGLKPNWVDSSGGLKYDKRNITFYPKWSAPRFTWERHGGIICLGWGELFWGFQSMEGPTWGFYWYEHTLVICKGKTQKHIDMPYTRKCYRSSILLKDGKTWEHELTSEGNKLQNKDFWDSEKWKDKRWSNNFSFIYKSKKFGKVASGVAHVTIDEIEFRIRSCMWATINRRIYKKLWVEFDTELGDESGSWKGGVVGSGIEMKKGEKPSEAFQRMMSERRW